MWKKMPPAGSQTSNQKNLERAKFLPQLPRPLFPRGVMKFTKM